MATNFDDYLTVEQKKSILIQRIQQFAAEGYQLTLNKKFAEGKNEVAAVSEIEDSISSLSAAIDIYKAELDALPEVEATE
jgi:hypothetical protein